MDPSGGRRLELGRVVITSEVDPVVGGSKGGHRQGKQAGCEGSELLDAVHGVRGEERWRDHYYKNLNRGGQKQLIEAFFATASDEKSW